MSNLQHYATTTHDTSGTSAGQVRARLRVAHLILGSILGGYPYLPATTPGHGILRWALMIVVVPILTVSGLWLWKQAVVRRWLRARTARH